MLTTEQCKKVLGERAKNYTDEQIETMRDEIYIAANLAFEHWRSSSTKGEEQSSLVVGEQPAPASIPIKG